ncbi:MAG: LytR/AlgR family response regulator transcription factor [Bacillota bacterium]
MKLKVAIAEDEKHMRTILKKALESVQEVEIIYETDNGRDLVEYVEVLHPHAIFLDIEMPGLNGLEAAKEIVDIHPETALVFVTGFPEHMKDAFQLYAFDYLVKPFKPERISQTAKKILKTVTTTRKAALYELTDYFEPSVCNTLPKLIISSNGCKVFINQTEITLVTRDQRKSLIYTVNCKEPVQTNEPLNSIFDRLNNKMFFRSHKSFIINLNYVERLDNWGAKSHQVSMKFTNEKGLVSNSLIKELEEMLSGRTS